MMTEKYLEFYTDEKIKTMDKLIPIYNTIEIDGKTHIIEDESWNELKGIRNGYRIGDDELNNTPAFLTPQAIRLINYYTVSSISKIIKNCKKDMADKKKFEIIEM